MGSEEVSQEPREALRALRAHLASQHPSSTIHRLWLI